ncbi:hypothetical protein ACFLZC_01590 [Patescibacteria group bacterium]
MSKSECEQVQQEYQELKTLKTEFDLEYQKAVETGDLNRAKELKQELEQKRDILSSKLWIFESLPQKELREQYQSQMDLYKERGFLETLSSGQEGIKDEKDNEYPIPDINEVMVKLKSKELFKEKIETMENPFILITPFALSLETMKDSYGQQIEEHFVEERIEGDRRIPDKDKTKLFGLDQEPLELRTDKQNIYFSDSLKTLSYFPEWKEEGNSVKTIGGMTKKEAITQRGGWKISIIENISLAPEAGQGKTIEKEIKIKGKTKKVKRKQVEGGLNTAKQYELLKQQNEEGLTPEDWLSLALLHLKEKNTVLDDDRKTNYYCRLPGAVTSDVRVPVAFWGRDARRAGLDRGVPGYSDSDFGVRGAVRVF